MAGVPPPEPRPTSQLIEPAFKSVVDLSLEVYRQMGLMHGGAIIAILTFVGHYSRSRLPIVSLFVTLGVFALGLWLNIESMDKSRQMQTAIFNREHSRMWAFHMMSAGQFEQATIIMNEALKFDSEHDAHLRSAMNLLRGSVAAFIVGSFAAVVTVMWHFF